MAARSVAGGRGGVPGSAELHDAAGPVPGGPDQSAHAFQPGRSGWQWQDPRARKDRKSTRLNSSHGYISYAVFCLKKKKSTRRATVINTKIDNHHENLTYIRMD